MNEQQLRRMDTWFREKPGRITVLRGVNAACTYGTAAVFLGVCAELALRRDPTLIRLGLTCGVPLVLLSVVRKWIDAPRPYEVCHLDPLIPKESRGQSFPSRHVFSSFVIGTSLMYLHPVLGASLLLLGVLLAAVRVVSGMHFLRDVLVGALVGVLSAMIGFGIVP